MAYVWFSFTIMTLLWGGKINNKQIKMTYEVEVCVEGMQVERNSENLSRALNSSLLR